MKVHASTNLHFNRKMKLWPNKILILSNYKVYVYINSMSAKETSGILKFVHGVNVVTYGKYC